MVFSSVYEITDDICTVRKQHMWCWFDGDSNQPRWTQRCGAGTGTVAMVDAVDAGLGITTDTGTFDNTCIYQNDIQHYEETGAVAIWVDRITVGTLVLQRIGFVETINFLNSFSFVNTDSIATKIRLHTDSGSSCSVSCSCVCTDTNFHAHKIELRACDNLLTICGGCVDITKTTLLPDQPQQLFNQMLTRTTAARTSETRYVEAFNT